MRLEFYAKTNMVPPMINTITLKAADGKEYTIDRDTTEYTFEEEINEMSMLWKGVYIWDGEKEDYDLSKDLFTGGAIINVEIEDDAPEGYFVKLIECNADGENILVRRDTGHKYYDDLYPESSGEICLFNTNEREQEMTDGQLKDTERQKNWDEQKKCCGFDSRETWALDFTASMWLHSHLKMYLEEAGKMVNLGYHSFEIPVLYPNPEFNAQACETTSPYEVPPYIEKNEAHTQQECIELMIEYLEPYIISDKYAGNIAEDVMRMVKCGCAFRIFGIVLPAMWW